MLFFRLGLCLLACVTFTFCRAELFVSLSEAQRLVRLERQLVQSVTTHITHAEFELDAIKARFEELKKIRREIKTLRKGLTPKDYSENPINAYAIVKRMSTEWPHTFQLMASQSSIKEATIPDKSSAILDDMIAGLVKFQEDNSIDTKILARGKLNGTRPHANLTAEDCWKIGRHYYNKSNVSMALHWLREARYKLEDQTVDPKKVLEYIFLSKCLNGDMEGSIAAYRGMLDKRGEWQSSTKELSNEYDREDIRRCKIAAVKVKGSSKATPVKKYNVASELCRGKGLVARKKRDLACFQVSFDDPYLKLQPNKVEQIYHSPLIIMLHDILRGQDIFDIKEIVVSQLKTMKMGSNGPVILPNDTQRYLNERISILKNFLEEQMILEGNRVTVLSPGSNYTSVVDPPNEGKNEDNKYNRNPKTKKNKEKADKKGEKGKLEVIGKIIYFLSEETQGGHTVFPSLRLTVAPRRGSALLWFNPVLTGYAEGEATEIGECPVIMGTKWVMTNRILGENLDR